MANSKKLCRGCDKYFPTESMTRFGSMMFCCFEHAVRFLNDKKTKEIGKRLLEKETRKANKSRREELRPRSWYLKEAQKWFNKFIRLRDRDEACVSCDKPNNGMHQRHASHYRSVGACSSMRYNEQNVWASCSVCNNYLSGNLAEYRIRLIDKIGLEQVEWIERQPKTKAWSIEELKEIIQTYKGKCKELEL